MFKPASVFKLGRDRRAKIAGWRFYQRGKFVGCGQARSDSVGIVLEGVAFGGIRPEASIRLAARLKESICAYPFFLLRIDGDSDVEEKGKSDVYQRMSRVSPMSTSFRGAKGRQERNSASLQMAKSPKHQDCTSS